MSDPEQWTLRGDGWEIFHKQGNYDPYLVVVDHGEGLWAPTNPEIFGLVSAWLFSEDYKYSEGYGKQMPWFYLNAIYLGRQDVALAACGMEKGPALDHFERAVAELGPVIREEMLALEREVGP